MITCVLKERGEEGGAARLGSGGGGPRSWVLGLFEEAVSKCGRSVILREHMYFCSL